MKAVLTAVIAAIEAAAVALAGLAIVAVLAVLVWWLGFDLGADLPDLAAAIAGVWLLGHFVPLAFELVPEAAQGLGLDPVATDFGVSLAPLGLTLFSVLLAFRAGRRFAARGGAGAAGVLGGALGFGGAAAVVAMVGAPLIAWPIWVGAAVPALCFGAGSGAGYLQRAAHDGHSWWLAAVRWVQRRIEPLSPLGAAALPIRAAEVLRLAVAAVAALVGLGALGLAVAIVIGYVDIVSLSQGLQLDPLGAIVLFALAFALLPVAGIWVIAWFTGAGFAIGSGTSVTPFETLLGPLPALPLLGAVPDAGWGAAGGLAPALIVLLGVVLGALAGRRAELRHAPLGVAILSPLLAALLVGLVVAGLAALATGSIGPGRLAVTGPQPWPTGGLAAAEIGAGLLLGVLARRLDLARLGEVELALPNRRLGSPAPTSPTVPGSSAEAEAETVPLEPLGPETAHDETAPDAAAFQAPAPDSGPGDSAPGVSDSGVSDPDAPGAVASPGDADRGGDPLLQAFSWEGGAAGPGAGGAPSSPGGSATGLGGRLRRAMRPFGRPDDAER